MDERKGLQSVDIAHRLLAAEKLSVMGPDAAPAAVELVQACADEDEVREFAVSALEQLGPPPVDTLSGLTMLASSDESLVAYWAITLLARAGTQARSSQSKLASVLSDANDISVKERAAWALGRIQADSEAVVQALNQAANSSEARLSRVAQTSLDQIKRLSEKGSDPLEASRSR